jgi:UvrD-like helicase C-terminal domain/Nuclease-related domain/AAA domain
MARMLPPEIAAANPSTAEKRLFVRLRDGLDDQWTVLHSLGLGGHPLKPWAEIDFVLISALAVISLEVKGGRVERRDGLWWFTDWANRSNSKAQGPFEQVGSATGALTQYLGSRLHWVVRRPIGYGVVTPDIEFRVTGPDVIPEIVYDARDAKKPIADYIARVVQYWERRFVGARTGNGAPFSRSETTSIVQALRPDFDLRPSLRMRLGQIAQELLRLTTQQYVVLDGLVDNERVVVRGGAGTGKTFLAVEEARRLAVGGSKVLLCCFNRALGEHLAAVVGDHPNITAGSLHSFMAQLISNAGLASTVPRATTAEVHEIYQPIVAIEALRQAGIHHSFDALVVDEAQDLVQDAYLAVFDAALRDGLDGGKWRFFLDPMQNLFDGLVPSGLKRLEKCRPATFRLRINCRNATPVAVAVGLLSGTLPEQTREIDGPEVAIVWCRGPEDERRQASRHVGRLLAQGLQLNDIVILSSHRLENSCLARGLVGLPVTLTLDEPPSRSGWIRYRTVHSFKGLESDAVLLVDCDQLGSASSRGLMYVGASRARSQLAVFLDESSRPEYDALARKFGRNLIDSPDARQLFDAAQ